MTSGPLERSVKDITSAHPEVEFALVLARTIDAVSADPEQLRSAVYELARHKLQELATDDPSEKQRLMKALEVAIEGVEAHTQSNGPAQLAPPPTVRPVRIAHEAVPNLLDRPGSLRGEAAADPILPGRDSAAAPARRRRGWSSSVPLRFLVMLAVLGTVLVLIALQRRDAFSSLRTTVAGALSARPSASVEPVEVPVAPVSAQPTPEPRLEPKRALPTAYGVYAEVAEKLYELEMLQGRAPDPRVAISAAITKPSITVLPDGRVKFIVFRRESGAAASDPIEVRIIARVNQVTTFDAAGKPLLASASGDEKTWVMRNVSIPFRAAPLKEDPQMIEVQPRDPDVPLPPGRYALVLKTQAYDFTVEGAVTDRRHCMQRLSAANGTFYSECEKP
ncbi:hypothetical protein SSBR45G_16340 [Bradyrhizobium sp. SSBR45G]|uniref:hypothetical protein n=1 Tax=unclassified Bradyrhizobium TaxID=2631580 RepID=UPI00234298A1|nr:MULTISPECIES: hypothetical protein [unclassified Bradyrhizobium]GLH76726.1 hypothetical protein SSBR45G_16340 [Bradyrhizobium sp. SSBR45G]GLH83484.1 hypothetical protein SSBR45R_09440 [Bradyrhizobium sp. SSBR45R]